MKCRLNKDLLILVMLTKIREISYYLCYTGLTDKKIIHGRKMDSRSGLGQAYLPCEIIGMPDNPEKR